MIPAETFKNCGGAHDILHFELLGLRIQVQFACLRAQAAVEAYLNAHQRPITEESPDICIYLAEPLETDRFRYLFRTQPANQVQDLGITILHPGGTWQRWQHPEPILIPFALPQLRNRFTALHAGGCVNPSTGKATLIMGKKGAGKTTISFCLAHQFSWPLLSDETAVIDIWSRMAWPLVRPLQVLLPSTSGECSKTQIDTTKLPIADLSRINRIIELVHVPGLKQPKTVTLKEPMAALATLCRHSIEFGSERHVVSRCLAKLCSSCTVLQTLHGGYHHLKRIAHDLGATDVI